LTSSAGMSSLARDSDFSEDHQAGGRSESKVGSVWTQPVQALQG